MAPQLTIYALLPFAEKANREKSLKETMSLIQKWKEKSLN